MSIPPIVLFGALAVLAGCVSAADTGQASPEERGINAFGLELHRQLAKEGGNQFHSPYSISSALAMAWGGARGNTESQMSGVLHFGLPQERLHASFAALRTDLTTMGQRGKVKLETANSLWPRAGHPLLPVYQELCTRHYGAAPSPLDFSDPGKAAEVINGWISRQTHGKIPALCTREMLAGDIRLILANAIYFCGDWMNQFNPALTKNEPFFLADGKSATVPLMRRLGYYRHAAADGIRMVELPYKGGELSMCILLPAEADGLARMESRLDRELLEKLCDKKGIATLTSVAIALPQFKIESRFMLGNTLAAMGMTDAFCDKADFSGMNGKGGLALGRVVHGAVVEVNEKGTVAAAATLGDPFAGEPEKPVYFRADRPFLFLIRLTKTGEILFMGRMENPSDGG